MGLSFVDGLGRADRDNAIDVYMGTNTRMCWRKAYGRRNSRSNLPYSPGRKNGPGWIGSPGVTLGSDAFFPFSDNIERAHKSGVAYIAQPGGSVRDDAVIECCDKYGMAMVFTGIRLFHH